MGTLSLVGLSAMDFKSNASSPRAVGGRVAAATVRSAIALLVVGDVCWRKVDAVCKPTHNAAGRCCTCRLCDGGPWQQGCSARAVKAQHCLSTAVGSYSLVFVPGHTCVTFNTWEHNSIATALLYVPHITVRSVRDIV